MSIYARVMVENAKLEMELAQVLCEWDGQIPCHCRDLAPDDEARCKSPIGIARVLLHKYHMQRRDHRHEGK
jgi:hypothetical protein